MTLDIASLSERDIAKTIDHSLLRPELTDQQVEDGCRLAARYDVASVCCRPADVARAAALLAGTDVKVGSTVGFPHGNHLTAIKVAETRQALADGATEIDMVLQIGALRSGRDAEVQTDIAAVVEVAHAAGAIVKVIFENAYLNDDEKVRACRLTEAAGADFVKTSTGFAASGATHDDLRLMRANTSPHIQVKAAGGVRTLDALLAGTDVKVGSTVGFPHGNHLTAIKVAETRQALADGATEIDMVLQIGALKSGRDAEVQADIAAVVDVAHAAGAIVKVIFENAYLTDDEKVRACRLTEAAGGDFVKTSTGFAPSGATHDDLRLMRANTSPHIQVKAAGGVRTLDALLAVMELGVTRIGATATEAIILDFRARKAGLATASAGNGALEGGY